MRISDWSSDVCSSDLLGDFLATRLARYKLPASYEFTDEPLRDEAGNVRRSQLRAERIAAKPSPGSLGPHGSNRATIALSLLMCPAVWLVVVSIDFLAPPVACTEQVPGVTPFGGRFIHEPNSFA